jgi:hypothetical protein
MSEGCSLPYGLLSVTCLYVAMAASLEVYAPACFDEENCLANGVDNSTSTIVTGFAVSFAVLLLAFQLTCAKNCKHMSKSTIRTSGIMAQVLMAAGLLLQTLARLLQPNQSIGKAVYWSLWSTSFIAIAFSLYSHGKFAMKAIGKKFRVRVCCSGSRIGCPAFLVMCSSFLVFGAGISCACLDSTGEIQGNSTNTTDNIFDQDTNRMLEEPISNNGTASNSTASNSTGLVFEPFEREHVCQDIAHYGAYAFYFSSFFFWYATSKVLRKAVRNKQFEGIDGYMDGLNVWGLSTTTAVLLLPWAAFAIGNLYPVWVWLASDFADMVLMEVSQLSYEGIIYHYGIFLMAWLAHNWTYTLTADRGEKDEERTLFTQDVFHDLTLGAFEAKVRREAAFNDLTLGAFEASKPVAS